MTDEQRVSEGTLNAMLHGEQTSVSYLMALELKKFRADERKTEMTDEPKETPSETLRMSAYYYSFEPTGNPAIDRILSAVACAGKAYHHTEEWSEDTTPYPGHIGASPVDWIQNAANDAANEFRDEFAQRAPEKWKPLPCAVCGEPNTTEHHASHNQRAQAVPRHLARRGMRSDGTLPPSDDDEAMTSHDRLAQCQGKWVTEQKSSDAPICACGDSFTADAQCVNCTQGLRDWMETYHPAELEAFDAEKKP